MLDYYKRKKRIFEMTIPKSITYAQLLNIQQTGNLIASQTYKITDFRTRHAILNTVGVYNEGPIEPLTVYAISNTELAAEADSESYPKDIIYYEITCTHIWGTMQDAVIDGPDRGWIYYREDTLKNNKLTYDFRNVKWRRWNSQADGLGTWSVLTDNTFPYQDFLTFVIYNETNAGNDFSISGSKASDSDTSQRVTTFNNVFHGSAAVNKCRGALRNNTFLGDIHQNEFGVEFNNNVVGTGFRYNTIQDNFNTNTIGNTFAQNRIDEDCSSCNFGASCKNLVIGNLCTGLIFASGCDNIHIAPYCSNLDFDPNCKDIIILDSNITGISFAITDNGSIINSGFIRNSRGANVASGSTITPTGQIFHVTGITTIDTISIPVAGFNGTITIIPDGIFLTVATGNIAIGSTSVVSKALHMTYDNTTAKWYPSY